MSPNKDQKQMLEMHFARKTVAKRPLVADQQACKTRRRIEELEEKKRLENELFL